MASEAGFLRQLLRRAGLGSRYQLPTRETWEREYREGSWDYLRADEEMPRYAVIATCLRTHCPGGALLDAGCGEGILCDHLWPGSYSQYLGIDFSAAAIERARARPRRQASFDVGDVTSYAPGPDRRFDAIIFNEVLYCTNDPAAVIAHWQPFLQPQGIMIASIYAPWMKKMQPVLQAAEAQARWTEAYAVHHPRTGRSWVIRAWGAAARPMR
jgi:2-polyprenyl-3-methyl-5-hydroxy-6-metoxy-1,4-benzoquinol methylase